MLQRLPIPRRSRDQLSQPSLLFLPKASQIMGTGTLVPIKAQRQLLQLGAAENHSVAFLRIEMFFPAPIWICAADGQEPYIERQFFEGLEAG